MIENLQTSKDLDERVRMGRINLTRDAFRVMFNEELTLEDAFAEKYAVIFGEALEVLANRFLSNQKGA